MKTREIIIEAAKPTGTNKVAVENPLEAPNTEAAGSSKTIIGAIPRQPWTT